MSAFIGKAGKKVFLPVVTSRFAPPDPYYETYFDDKGKQRRRKRALPPGLSKQDAAILRAVQKRARHLDEGFHILGMKFGWTFLIGIIPVVGDVANFTLNHTLVVRKAKEAGIPASLLRRMKVHNVISTGVGMVPVLGDICFAVYKPNSRNAAMLEELLRVRGEEALRLNPQVDGQPPTSALSRLKGRSLFRRNDKNSEQVNSTPVSGMPAHSSTGATRPSNSKVDGRLTSRIFSRSNRNGERRISATSLDNTGNDHTKSSLRGKGGFVDN